MPAWLIPIIIKFAVPFIVKLLVKDKIIPSSVGEAIKDYESLKANLKIEPAYPEGRAGQGTKNT